MKSIARVSMLVIVAAFIFVVGFGRDADLGAAGVCWSLVGRTEAAPTATRMGDGPKDGAYEDYAPDPMAANPQASLFVLVSYGAIWLFSIAYAAWIWRQQAKVKAELRELHAQVRALQGGEAPPA